ncbi:MAG: peptidoglycan editing factor PgeF [Alysiella sp.]|uniref:peptidoglycan editing factor PgeF n=1 Tax=Alysiella sp. TaxID=1872483 RepID=UPI0026DCF0AE|nr:peptidoglycan editing factor PgeF [Alysiella sp.]MDO4433406.1 peptidoglycan editing factor PgeF [Alysiella sp.]
MSKTIFSAHQLSDFLNLNHAPKSCFTADWSAPPNVKTLISTRQGGVSKGIYASLNVGAHVGDVPENVAENRARVQQYIALPVAYLNQTHSTTVVQAAEVLQVAIPPEADAAVDKTGKVACAVMTADCLPVLFCDRAGTVVAAAHAGWRGLAAGVLQNTIDKMGVAPIEIMAYLGPAIGAESFEVGQDVYDAFCAQHHAAQTAFQVIGEGKYLADIYLLARQILQREGVTQIYGGTHCTVLERDAFFSYRRDGQTGRMVSAIWLEKAA